MRAMLGLHFTSLSVVVVILVGLAAIEVKGADPKHLPARSDILRAIDADSCDREMDHLRSSLLFPVSTQWEVADEARNFGIWEKEETSFSKVVAGLFFPAWQDNHIDPMTVTTQPLVFRDQLYASRFTCDRSAIKLFRHDLTIPSTREPDLPPVRTTRYLLTSFMLGFFSIHDVYVNELVDLRFVNLLMHQSWEALLNGDRIEAEQLLGQAWFHDPESVASHLLLPRIHVLSNVVLNLEQPTLDIRQQLTQLEIPWRD